MIKFVEVIKEFLADETEREIHYLDIETTGKDGESIRIDKKYGYEKVKIAVDQENEWIEIKHERTDQRGFKYFNTKYIKVEYIVQVEVTKSGV